MFYNIEYVGKIIHLFIDMYTNSGYLASKYFYWKIVLEHRCPAPTAMNQGFLDVAAHQAHTEGVSSPDFLPPSPIRFSEKWGLEI